MAVPIQRPGEICLAHRGVLFLDEIAEFQKKTLDMLRQPLEAGSVTISRAQTTVKYPSSFILIAAMNPCPCVCLVPIPIIVYVHQSKFNLTKREFQDRFMIVWTFFLSLKSVNLDQPVAENKSSIEFPQHCRKSEGEAVC